MLWVISLCLLCAVCLIAAATFSNRLAKMFLLLSALGPRRLEPVPRSRKAKSSKVPSVAIHVAISSEDPSIVLATLSSLARLDYPKFHVVVVDNNTDDEELWRPVEFFCRQHSELFDFYHVNPLAGHKAGALNYALERTPPEAEFIAVVDADNIVEASFLRCGIECFDNEKVAIVQTPLGFLSDPREHAFRSWVFLIYRYFLAIYMPAANRFDSAPFIGAMGILRRSALEEVGRWRGTYLTEDMELSYRLFRHGYISRFLDRPYGRTMPPHDFSNFAKQHYRWNFGNAQIIRDYLIRSPSRCWGPRGGIIGQVVYFACPGIYINAYLLPFALVATAYVVATAMGIRMAFSGLCSQIMLVLLGCEVVGEALMFAVLGKRERVAWQDCLRSFLAWWSLALNNAHSTWSVLFRRTRPFEITEKRQAQSGATARGGRRWVELALSGAAFFLALLPLLASCHCVPLAALVLAAIGALLSTSLVLSLVSARSQE